MSVVSPCARCLRSSVPHGSRHARKLRAAQGWAYDFTARDLYADAIPCLTVLRERGYKVLIAGNQPIEPRPPSRGWTCPPT